MDQTGQTTQNPHDFAPSPPASGSGVLWDRGSGAALQPRHHNPPEVEEKQNGCPTGQISFRFHDHNPRLTRFPFLLSIYNSPNRVLFLYNFLPEKQLPLLTFS